MIPFAQVFNAGHSLALPLLHYSRDEPLGHRLPLLGVSCILWYVLRAPKPAETPSSRR